MEEVSIKLIKKVLLRALLKAISKGSIYSMI